MSIERVVTQEMNNWFFNQSTGRALISSPVVEGLHAHPHFLCTLQARYYDCFLS